MTQPVAVSPPRAWLGAIPLGPKLRFILVGGANTVLGYGVFAVLQATLGARIGYIGSLLLAHVLVSLIAFALYRRLVFRVKGNVLVDFLRFQGVYAFSLTANVIVLPLIVELLGLNAYLGQAISVVVVTVCSYTGHRYFSFRRVRDDDGAQRAL